MSKLYKDRQITLYASKGLFILYIGLEVITFSSLEKFNILKEALKKNNYIYLASFSQVKNRSLLNFSENILENSNVEGFSYFGNALKVNRLAEEIEITEYWIEEDSYSNKELFTPIEFNGELEGVFFVGSYSDFTGSKNILFGKPDWMDLKDAIIIAGIILDNTFSDIYFIGEKGKQQFKEVFK